MGKETRTFGGFGAMAAICLAFVALLALNAAQAAARTLYVGGTRDYSVALKTEAGRHYVIQLAGVAHCHFNEPLEDLGPTGFSMFQAPTAMRERRGEWVAGNSQYELFGSGSAQVRATFGRDAATGTYAYGYSLESEHCATDGREPFSARRYVPAGSPEAGSPIRHLAKTYYGKEGRMEVYLAVRGGIVGGIRGDFVSACRAGRRKAGEARPLFAVPETFKRGSDNRFSGRGTATGAMGHGERFKESFALSGKVGRDEVAGSYRRIRTVTRGDRRIERCVTGPLRFRAAHYLPAKPRSPR